MKSDTYDVSFSVIGKSMIHLLNSEVIKTLIIVFIIYFCIKKRNSKLDKKRSIEKKEEERLKEESNKQFIKEITKKVQILEETQIIQRNSIQDVKEEFNKKLNIHNNKQIQLENYEDELKKMHDINEERSNKYFNSLKKTSQNVDEFTNLLTKRYFEIDDKNYIKVFMVK